jgi:hypothetical protein
MLAVFIAAASQFCPGELDEANPLRTSLSRRFFKDAL